MILLVSLIVICRVDSIEKFRAKLPSLRAELKDDSEFPFLKAKLDNVLLVGVRCGLLVQIILQCIQSLHPWQKCFLFFRIGLWSEMISFSFPYPTGVFTHFSLR